jgi:hypothetical protein
MSKIEVNTIEPQCGTTLTLGGSGDTVTLASGASQSGFKAVDWVTDSIKTATFTAVSGKGYFCNTNGGAFNITLPSSPSAGDTVALKDYNGKFSTNNLTIDRNGSKLDANELNKALDTDNLSMTLVYVDATQGWKSVEEGTGYIGENFIVATGGTITTSGNCKIHKFTGPGTFTVCSVACSAANNLVSYMVVAGGAGGGWDRGGGGGAGGFRETKSPSTPYTASPLDGYATPGNRITVTAQGYPIVVGGGGTGGSTGVPTARGGTGGVSSFSTITSAGGGGGGAANPSAPTGPGVAGASGGGAGNRQSCGTQPGGAGNTPPVTPPQGNTGGPAVGPGPVTPGGGGGGATAVGTTATASVGNGVTGGAGATTHITGSPVAYAGGGGGGASYCCGSTCRTGGAGGTGGGGAGGNSPGGNVGTAGTANTGGGGGGGGNPSGSGPSVGGNGGSGVVIIRYKYQ